MNPKQQVMNPKQKVMNPKQQVMIPKQTLMIPKQQVMIPMKLLGGSWGAKRAPGVRRRLAEGVRFGWVVPWGGLARARLIQ